MARSPNPKEEQAKKLYKKGMKLVEIASQLGIPDGTIRRWKSEHNWDGDTEIKIEHSKASARIKKNERSEKAFDNATKDTMKNESLTHEQRLFCIYYVKSFNATLSYQKANKCSYDVANSHGYKWLSKVGIKEEIQRLQEIKRQQIVANESDLVELQMRIAFSDIGNYVNFKGYGVELEDSNEVDTQLIREVKEGKNGIEIKLADQQKAIDWLTRYFNMNPLDKHKIEFDKAKLELDRKKAEPDDIKTDEQHYNGIPATMIAPAFAKVVFSIAEREYLEYVFPGGRGSTKSSFISLEVIDLIEKNPTMHACIMRQVADTLRTSVYQQVLWAIQALGLENEYKCTVSPLEITKIRTGQKIYFRGADDPDKIKSIKVPFGYIGIAWFEELDQFQGANAVRKIEQSVIRGGDIAYIFKSFNPPKSANNWANKYIKIPKATRMVVHSTYLDVPKSWLGKPFLDEAKFLKETNPEAYENEYMGVANGSGGNVFDNVTIRSIADEEIAEFDRVLNGLDWGWFPDPFHFVRCQYDAARLRLFIFAEYRCNKQSNRQTADVLIENYGITSNDIITCDSAENKSIGDYKSYGLLARAAEKGPGSVEYSMKWLQSLVEIVIDNERCPNTANEFLNYEYERDKDGEIISSYPDKDNHGIDAVRYATNRIWKRRGE